MSLERYDTYKDSGVDWLGDIPTHWVFSRIKTIGSVNGRVGWKALKASEYVDSGYFFLATPNIKERNIDYDNVNYITYERFIESPEIILKEDDILLTKDGSTLGTINIVKNLPGSGTVNSSIAVLRFKKILNNDYAFFLIVSDYIQNLISQKKDGMGVPHLFQKDINNFLLLVPPIKEQTAIAFYLGRKTEGIDSKVTLLEQKIIHYQQLRKSLINETVCRGLDKNVKLIDSGIEWIGKIPEHWEVKRLKDIGYLYSGLTGKAGDDFNQDATSESKYFIPFTNIANNQFINQSDLRTVLMEDNEIQNKVRKNDLFFLMSSENFEDLGKTALLKEDIKDTYLNSFCKGYRITNKHTFPIYINYLLNSKSFKERLSNQGKGFTRINLKMEKVNDLNIIAPPQHEQIGIATFLDEKTQQIDSIITNIKSQISTLKELRKTLINDVVTGKIKVSG